jgi:hypothetical protein
MAGNREVLRTTPVLHVIPVGTSLLEKEDFTVKGGREPIKANSPAIKERVKTLERFRQGVRGTERDPIKAFENPTVAGALNSLRTTYGSPLELKSLETVYRVLRHLDPKIELEKRLYPGSNKSDLLPAELSSLYLFYGQMASKPSGEKEFHMPPAPGVKDDFFLLATDTIAGAFSACCLRNYLSESTPPVPTICPFVQDVRMTILSGLQVEDADRFAKQGSAQLKAARDAAAHWAEERGTKVYLNVTGGFKGVLPIISALGLARTWDLYYAFEESPARINITVSGVVFRELRLELQSDIGRHYAAL